MRQAVLLDFHCFLIATLALSVVASPADVNSNISIEDDTVEQPVDHKPKIHTQPGGNPWMVGFYCNGFYTAAGTLIKNDVVLTAAQPIAVIPQDHLVVVAGEWDRLKTTEWRPHFIRRVRSIAINAIVALVSLDTPFFPFPHILPANLPPPNAVFTETSCQTVGWGQPESSVDSDRMWFQEYSVMSREDCDYYFNIYKKTF